MFSSFSFLRYGHQTEDIKPFPKLTSARLFSQEPPKKLFLRRHEASLKIFEDQACKVPIKSSFFAAFVLLVKTLFISTSALSYGDKAWPIFALGGLAIWPRRISKKRTGETGTLFVAEIGQKISKRDSQRHKGSLQQFQQRCNGGWKHLRTLWCNNRSSSGWCFGPLPFYYFCWLPFG